MEGPVDPVEAWIGGQDAIPVVDDASVSLVRERVRELGAQVRLPEVTTASLVSVASELAHNQVRHAHGGAVAIRTFVRGQEVGLEVIAADAGPGIVDVARALEGRRSGPGSLGSGLAAVMELADEVDFDVRLGEGTCIWARKLSSLQVRRRRVGIYGQAYEGEVLSGDDAAFVRTPDALLVGVIDGLGHGPEARDPAARSRCVLVEHPELDLEGILAQVDAELHGTRGAVMTVARFQEAEGRLTLAAVGNVGAQYYGVHASRRFGGSSFVLGSPGGARHIRPEAHDLGRMDALVLFSDGVSSRMSLEEERGLLREHPIVIAQRVVERFGRSNDDVLVLVVA